MAHRRIEETQLFIEAPGGPEALLALLLDTEARLDVGPEIFNHHIDGSR